MTQQKHQWSAVCDENSNQKGDFIHCDLCNATVHMYQVTNPINGNIIRPRGWGRDKSKAL